MRNVMTMAGREVGAYFLSPIAYVVLAVFLFACGLSFGLGTIARGEESSLRYLLAQWMPYFLVFVLPMLTMRLLSEEYRNGTIETLLTAPITESEVVLGKFFGALAFFGVMAATLLLYPVILAGIGTLDGKLLFCNYIGLALLGALYIAVGLFFSACTRHQIIAVLLSFAVLAIITFASFALAPKVQIGWIRAVMQQISVQVHFTDFVRGMLDLNHIVFFVTTTALFLFLTVKRLEMRRWQ